MAPGAKNYYRLKLNGDQAKYRLFIETLRLKFKYGPQRFNVTCLTGSVVKVSIFTTSSLCLRIPRTGGPRRIFLLLKRYAVKICRKGSSYSKAFNLFQLFKLSCNYFKFEKTSLFKTIIQAVRSSGLHINVNISVSIRSLMLMQ